MDYGRLYWARITQARLIVHSEEFHIAGTNRQRQIVNTLLAKGLAKADLRFLLALRRLEIRLVTLNIGYNVMANRLQGSEKTLVGICQKTYNSGTKHAGWDDARREISSCTLNAARFLLNYDLFALQEVNASYQGKFEEFIRERGKELLNQRKVFKDYVLQSSYYFGDFAITTGYDRNVMGEGIMITPKKFEIRDDVNLQSTDVRALHAIFFPFHALLLINVHAPHKINLKRVLEERCKVIQNYFEQLVGLVNLIERVIVTGDFNDDRQQLVGVELNIFGRRVKIPGSKAQQGLKTCCTDTKYAYAGDYILDSNASSKADSYGYPEGYKRLSPPMSDHDPAETRL